MTVYDLNRDQLIELKQHMITEENDRRGEGTSYGELADADNIVSDQEVFAEFGGTEFSPDDFSSSAGQETYSLVVDGAGSLTIDDIIEDLEYIKKAVIRRKHDGRAPHGSIWELERWS